MVVQYHSNFFYCDKIQKMSQQPTKSVKLPTDSAASSRTQHQSTSSTNEKEKSKIGTLPHHVLSYLLQYIVVV
jgi:hypothetical protein